MKKIQVKKTEKTNHELCNIDSVMGLRWICAVASFILLKTKKRGGDNYISTGSPAVDNMLINLSLSVELKLIAPFLRDSIKKVASDLFIFFKKLSLFLIKSFSPNATIFLPPFTKYKRSLNCFSDALLVNHLFLYPINPKTEPITTVADKATIIPFLITNYFNMLY